MPWRKCWFSVILNTLCSVLDLHQGRKLSKLPYRPLIFIRKADDMDIITHLPLTVLGAVVSAIAFAGVLIFVSIEDALKH